MQLWWSGFDISFGSTGSHGFLVMPSTLEPSPTVVVNDTLVAEVQAAKLINQEDGTCPWIASSLSLFFFPLYWAFLGLGQPKKEQWPF